MNDTLIAQFFKLCLCKYGHKICLKSISYGSMLDRNTIEDMIVERLDIFFSKVDY